jgi:transcriptional regulator with XRE-family HTH domain
MDTIQTPLHAALVKVLIAQRIRAGLRQRDVAARIGKPQSAIARIERGHLFGRAPLARRWRMTALSSSARWKLHDVKRFT